MLGAVRFSFGVLQHRAWGFGGATYYFFVELVDTKRPSTDVMRLKMRTWAGSVSITQTGTGLNMNAPTLTPHVNSAGEVLPIRIRFWMAFAMQALL